MGLPLRRVVGASILFLGLVWLAERAPGSRSPAVTGPRPDPAPAANRLAREQSPYLLQHADNPIHWNPWGEEAFARARREGKPIFLSIGYSTCHWCHVMERESFENDSVAALLNRDFVAIKVDREERPDVDRVYMTAVQAMGMGGGWPLTVFLTAEGKPFFGGTYFPPHTRFGRVGLMELLPEIQRTWVSRRGEIESGAARFVEALRAGAGRDTAGADAARLHRDGFAALAANQDSKHGGFGKAPKFPEPARLGFLERHARGNPRARAEALAMVRRQLDAMRAGGIHDQLGGGFHRYATDERWLVPHFEKMLYDQALLAIAYLEAFQTTRDSSYAETARGVFEYVARDLTIPEGAFAAAEDADSEGEEGAFYLWTPAQVESILGPADGALFCDRYGVPGDEPLEGGASILREARALEGVAARHGLGVADAKRRLESARASLRAARARRPRPARDDKVIAAWNGLMISALSRGACVLGDRTLAERAIRAADFVWSRLYDPRTGALRRHWRGRASDAPGQLDDFAHLARGFLDLYEATFDPVWLDRAVTLTESARSRFWDPGARVFFESPAGDSKLPLRLRADFDGAEVSGGSMMVANLAQLGALLERVAWREQARTAAAAYGRRLRGNPTAMPAMLAAIDVAFSAPRHLVIAGGSAAGDTRSLLAEFHRRFLPTALVLLVDGRGRGRTVARLAPAFADLKPIDGQATAYLCVNYACRLPTSDPARLGEQLDAPETSGSSR